jgi:hypothetical protein
MLDEGASLPRRNVVELELNRELSMTTPKITFVNAGPLGRIGIKRVSNSIYERSLTRVILSNNQVKARVHHQIKVREEPEIRNMNS